MLGDAAAKSAVADRTSHAAPLRDLVGRVEALERQVFGHTNAPEAPKPVLPPMPKVEPRPSKSTDVPKKPKGMPEPENSP